jgi:enoyl-CoA hydratase/carnithine racemase
VQATREALNVEFQTAFRAATERESFEQNWLRETQDYKEGVQASTDRRDANFTGS